MSGAALGLVLALLIRRLSRRTAHVRLPMCEPCEAAWLKVSWAPSALIIGGWFAGVAALTAACNGALGVGAGIAGWSMLVGRVVWEQVPKRRPRIRHINRVGLVTLDRAHRAAAGAIDGGCTRVLDEGVNAVPADHLRGCQDCQENRRILQALAAMHASVKSTPGWEKGLMAQIAAEEEARRRSGPGRR
jgi:hypothetical protein